MDPKSTSAEATSPLSWTVEVMMQLEVLAHLYNSPAQVTKKSPISIMDPLAVVRNTHRSPAFKMLPNHKNMN